MSFKEFLLARRESQDPKGDFVRLAVSDPDLPDASSWEELRVYIMKHHDNELITEAGAELWMEHQKAEKKARKA
jgi:uncharacterized protein YozE (UPF0346 family)